MRQQILNAVVAQITEAGERSVRLRDIARVVGIAEPSLYHYFPNREALIVEAQAQRLRESLAITINPFLKAVQSCTSREQFLDVLLNVYRHSYEPDRASARAVRAEIVGNSFQRAELRSVVADAFRTSLEETVVVLNVAKKQGWLGPSVDTTSFAMFNLSLISSLVFPEVYGDGELLENWKRFAEEAVTTIVMNS